MVDVPESSPQPEPQDGRQQPQDGWAQDVPHEPTALAWQVPGPREPQPPGGYPGAPYGRGPAAPGGDPGTPARQWPAQQRPGGQGAAGQRAGEQWPGEQRAGEQWPGEQWPARWPASGYAGGAGQQPTAEWPGAAPQPPQAGYPGAQQQPYAGYAGAAPPAGAQPYAYPGQYPSPQQQWGPPQPGYGGPGAAGAPGWPGSPAPGAPWPPAAGPAAPEPRRRGRLIAAIAAAIVVIAGAVTGVALYANRGESPAQLALDAGRAIAPAKVLHLAGTVSGRPAAFSVTAAGTVEGDYTAGTGTGTGTGTGAGSRVAMIGIDGMTYLKAPAAFWTSRKLTKDAAADAAGKWARAPAADAVMSFAALTPGRIASVLKNAGASPQAVSGTLRGTKVVRITEQGVTYVITAAGPGRLLHVSGTSGGSSYSYDVTALAAGGVTTAYQTMHGDVEALAGAADTRASVSAADKVIFSKNCDGATSCTITDKGALKDAAAESVLVKMTIYFSATKSGKSFATCSKTVTAHPPSQTALTLACTLGGTAWKHWVNSHTRNFTTWASPDWSATVNSEADIDALQGDLNQEQSGK